MPVDFPTIAADLLGQARSLLPQWFPAGKFRGHEFVVGNLAGESGESLSINANTGQWADFASGEKGGDLISLYAAMRKISQAEAAKMLSNVAEASPKTRRKQNQTTNIGMPPPDSEPESFDHKRFGPATCHWTYRDADGQVIGYISRHDPADSNKQIIPWSWDIDRCRWCNLSFRKPRPLYGLDLLATHPDAPVMIVEGEKSADAARTIVGTRYVVVTWPGGSKAVKMADWRPLQGRRLLLWPDADRQTYPTNHAKAGQQMPYEEQPGHLAMLEVAGILRPHCEDIKIIDVSEVEFDGWDAADALAGGWTWTTLLEWAKPRARAAGEIYAGSFDAPPEPDIDHETDGQGKRGVQNRIDLWDSLGLAYNASGAPYPNLDNAVKVIENHEALKGKVWWDEFIEKTMTSPGGSPREWTDADDIKLCLFLQRKISIPKMSVGTAHEAVVHVSRSHVRNSPQEWLKSLKWDRKQRLVDFIVYGFGADRNEYNIRVGECWMISMVARVMKPGCKVDTLPVFEGLQGTGKSSALLAIGGDWYAECHESILSKDFYGVLTGKMLVEIAELHSFTRAEVDRIKGIISCQVDRYRVPYGRNTQDHPRKCVFAGTTNRNDWNQDETGARRFWPIKCRGVDIQWLTDNRDQIFAEAVERYQLGEAWWTIPLEAATNEQEARRESDSWEDAIGEWVRKQELQRYYDFSAAQVLKEAIGLEVSRQGRGEQRRCASVMRLLGYENKVFRVSGTSIRRWVKVGLEFNPEQFAHLVNKTGEETTLPY